MKSTVEKKVVSIPYEAIDPLALGSAATDQQIRHDRLQLEVPRENLVANIIPYEPDPVPDVYQATREALLNPVSGPKFTNLIGPDRTLAIIIDNQFRPTPTPRILPAVLDLMDEVGVAGAVVVVANGKVFQMSEDELHMKIGEENWRRLQAKNIPVFQNDPPNPNAYRYIGTSSRGTPIWLHREVAAADVKITIGQTQAAHWGYSGGGKLILPGVTSDETIESNHAAFTLTPATHYGSLSGPLRADIDEVATIAGLDATLNVILDTRGRVIYMNFGRHPDAHRIAVNVFNEIYSFTNAQLDDRPADIAVCGTFAPTDHLFFHTGWGAMSADLVTREGATIIYASPCPGVHTAIGDFPGLALMDLMKPYMPPNRRNYERVLRDVHRRKIQMWSGVIWTPIYEVMTRKRLVLVTDPANLEMAHDIGIEATDSLQQAFDKALERHGKNARVVILPYARYQFPARAFTGYPEAVDGRHAGRIPIMQHALA
jgi:nickel-dependent lactate racemase